MGCARVQSLKRKQAEQDERLKGKGKDKQSDITISFRPKVPLRTGENVQLKLEGCQRPPPQPPDPRLMMDLF